MTYEERLESLISEGIRYTWETNHNADNYSSPTQEFRGWLVKVEHFLLTNFGPESAPYKMFAETDHRKLSGWHRSDFDRGLNRIKGTLLACREISAPKIEPTTSYNDRISNIFERFHFVVKALRHRHADRHTIDVNDEYDVQDLLYALLKLYFDDVRKEEYSPSYAGGASRVDFLLKKEETVIEVKKTRQDLRDKRLGEELIVDAARYKAHPDCKRLICFVYDPDGRINNPSGIETDLNSHTDNFKVNIVIKP